MKILTPNDFPVIKGKARQMVLRIQGGNRLILSPQAAFELGLRSDDKKSLSVLIAQDKKSIKVAPASKDQQEKSFAFRPASTSKSSKHPPFSHTNAGLAQHILDLYGLDPKAKSVALKIKQDQDWYILQPPA
jgi:hypothetical protein